MAAYTPEDFVVIEELIEAGNWVSLRRYLSENPQILDGDDQFTEELRKFLENTQSLYTALIFERSLFPDLEKGREENAQRSTQNSASAAPSVLPAQLPPESTIY